MSARYVYSLDNSQPMTTKVVTNADVVEGDILAITSGLVGPLAAADSGVIGIAMAAVSSGAEVPVLLLNSNSVVRVPYTGSTKTSLAAADRFGTAFDWNAASKKIDLDDTTGGIFRVVAYDNDNDTADVVVDASALWTA